MGDKFKLFSYNPDIVDYYGSDNLDEILQHVDRDRVSWVIVRDCLPSDLPQIETILSVFSANPAYVEKMFNETRREFSDHISTSLFIKHMLPTPDFDPITNAYSYNKGSIVFGENYLLLFEEAGDDFSTHVRERLQSGHSQTQKFGADYLLYQLLRAAIDRVEDLIFVELNNRFEALEDEIIANPGDDDSLEKLLAEREHVKALYEPLRRLDLYLVSFREGDVPFITPEVFQLFNQNLRSDYDGLEKGYIRLLSWWSQLLDLHRTNMSERSNNIMNILTIVSTIFLPITFITGMFGMNFVNMPGLENPNGFTILMVVMIAIVAGTIIYMKKKGWLLT